MKLFRGHRSLSCATGCSSHGHRYHKAISSLSRQGAQHNCSVSMVEASPVASSCSGPEPRSTSRRVILSAAAAALLTQWAWAAQPASAASQKVEPQLVQAFQDAMAATTYEESEAAWTRAIELSPTNSSAVSNRGTVRLQYGHWQAAYDDLQAALQLEQQQSGTPSAILLNNLGNAEGGLGRWSDAMQVCSR
eukprot:GHUV01026630.1.p1 GENE.GHUV01026630.1~~GHUV01026630.1.p1  ORF type:complete len:192 (+),score=62.67 GHUV01026630.1:171-746(+)